MTTTANKHNRPVAANQRIEEFHSPISKCVITDTKPSPRRTYCALGYSPESAQQLTDYGKIGVATMKLPNGKFPSKYLLQKFGANGCKLVQQETKQTVRAKFHRAAREHQDSVQSRLRKTGAGRALRTEQRQEQRQDISALKKELRNTRNVVQRFECKKQTELQLKKAYRNKTHRLKLSTQTQQQQIRALHTTVAELRAEIRCKLGLVATHREITNQELADAARKNIMINKREYSLSAYEAFRDVVCGAGLALNQVKFVTNCMFKLITGINGDFKVSRTVVKDAEDVECSLFKTLAL